MLDMFFSPGSVAVIGASRDTNKLGHGVLSNVIRYKNYTQEDRLVLARDMARQIIRILDRAGGSRAAKATPKAPPADVAEAR